MGYEKSLHDWRREEWDAQQDALERCLDTAMTEIMEKSAKEGADVMEDAVSRIYDNDAIAHQFQRALFEVWRSPEKASGPLATLRDLISSAIEQGLLRQAA